MQSRCVSIRLYLRLYTIPVREPPLPPPSPPTQTCTCAHTLHACTHAHPFTHTLTVSHTDTRTRTQTHTQTQTTYTHTHMQHEHVHDCTCLHTHHPAQALLAEVEGAEGVVRAGVQVVSTGDLPLHVATQQRSEHRCTHLYSNCTPTFTVVALGLRRSMCVSPSTTTSPASPALCR